MTTYPLAAIAHQPQLLLALSLLAVCPDIGGLLIRGDRGAAKSTAARGLAHLLPGGGPFVNLPLGATEDRVVGTLDLEAALQGQAKLKPGLMAQANGGLLYIDEVNLLPDHLVDVLLDAAALGVVRVQRDSLSAEAPARFALVGSMNPEEGTLRPQFLDRFGLCVDVNAPQDVSERAEIIRRRMAFEADAGKFAAQWQAQEDALGQRLGQAHAFFPSVQVPDGLLEVISKMTTAAGVRSLRADLVLHRAARAFAALEGRVTVTENDLHAVAPLVLLHRADPRQSQQNPPPPQQNPPPETQPPEPQNTPDSAPEEIFAPTPAAPLTLNHTATGRQASGDQSARERPGRVIRSVPNPQAGQLHLPATLQAAAQRGDSRIAREDFRAPVHEKTGGRRVLFVADASGSVGVSGRMGAVKGAMLGVLEAGGGRDWVALLTFRGAGAEFLLDWTTDRAAAEAAIRAAPTGGRTPLAHALQLAAAVVRGQPNAEVVIFTDGRANVPLSPGSDAWADALAQAAALQSVACTVVDTEGGQVRLGRAAALAGVLGAALQNI